MQQYAVLIYFTSKSLYMFRLSQHPKNCNRSLRCRSYDLYRRLRLQFLVLLMMGAVTPETCRVTLQWNKSDGILLHLVGLLFNVNYGPRNHEIKKEEKLVLTSIIFAGISTSVVRVTVCRQTNTLEHSTFCRSGKQTSLKRANISTAVHELQLK